jgi:hypothetical protein
MKQFLKKDDVVLLNGGYVSTKNGNPVSNQSFIDAQKHAEYIITFATVAKGKNFKSTPTASLQEVRNEVAKLLEEKQRIFIQKPKEVERDLTNKLAEEALSFMNYQKDLSKTDKINIFLQQFNVIAEFEEFGLFFDDEIVKLNQIYTLSEIVNAVTEIIDLL